MKTVTTVFLLLFFNSFFAQKTKTVEIYEYQYGIRSLHPTKIIEIYEDKIETYNVNFGIKELTPNEVIIDNKVYEVNNGIQELFPSKEIEIIED